MDCFIDTDFKKAIEFHGHRCPGLTIGYRVALIAIDCFPDKSQDEEIVAIVENNSCSIDAIQVINGCTFGKGNLIFNNHGKHVYTFFGRDEDKAFRISLIKDLSISNSSSTSKNIELFEKVINGNATEEEIKIHNQMKDKKILDILNFDTNDLFKIEQVNMKIPKKARIYPSIECEECKEHVMEPLAKKSGSKIVCIPCYNEKDEQS